MAISSENNGDLKVDLRSLYAKNLKIINVNLKNKKKNFIIILYILHYLRINSNQRIKITTNHTCNLI